MALSSGSIPGFILFSGIHFIFIPSLIRFTLESTLYPFLEKQGGGKKMFKI